MSAATTTNTTALGMDRLAELTPISLDQLVERAALLIRVDRKYVLSYADAEMLIATLPRTTMALEIAGDRSFGYTSLYYDTARLESYRQTAQRRRRRFKVRTRAYDNGATFLEVKTRRGPHTIKERTEWTLPGNQSLDAVGRSYAVDRLAAAGLDDPGQLLPTLWTRYRRSTLYLPDSGSRLTVDTNLAWQDTAGGARLDRPGLAIVETKSGSSPSSADRLLWSLGHRPQTISKYATGLAALHPGLPSNRWHRLLHRTFA
ncbi:MAG TPA: polyphosphate polymerase domain-containing protein [Propionibacteriaceae bacterium]|nr:polyphosphate polymerase domain-containing protein [Propionibacteriaceae bacterium]